MSQSIRSISPADAQTGAVTLEDRLLVDLFPLPLGPYERYMLTDATPAYPMHFVVTVDVSGDLQRDALEGALREALLRHPLFGCRVERIPGRGWCWVRIAGAAPCLDWEDCEIVADCPRGDPIDLTRTAGFRISVCREKSRARINFQFHHAMTDGLGSMQFIGDLLALYGQRTTAPGDEVPELEPLDPMLLRQRARKWPEDEKPQRNFLARFAGRALHLLSQLPTPLAAPRQAGLHVAGDGQSPAFVSRHFPRDVYLGLKEQAAARAVSINDLLILDMFQTIREWNRLCGSGDGRAWYRIGVPLSLRTPLDDHLPAANVLSFVFLTQRACACDREDGLLKYIHGESEYTVLGDPRVMFTYAVRLLLKVPGLLPGLLRIPVCHATVILSNVGDVRRSFRARFPLKQGRCVAGNVRLEALRGASPLRHKTRVAVALGTYAGSLFVNLQCDPRYFTPFDSERLADLFAERIRLRARTQSLLKAAS